MSEAKTLELANFICRFGSDKVLLDYIDEIVLPGFLDTNLKRKYGEASYFFHDVQLITFSTKAGYERAIAGRIIKKTSVSREQIFAGNKIVKDHQELPSAPSAVFVLLLSNHKLLYLRETKDAPHAATFATTAERFFVSKHHDYLDALHKASVASGNKISVSELTKSHPKPKVNLVALASEFTLTEFVNKFKIVNSMTIRVLDTNDEIDNSKLIEGIRSTKNATLASSAAASFSKRGETGLDKKAVTQLLTAPAVDGNTEISLSGTDAQDERLSGNNDDFKLKISISLITTSIEHAAKAMHDRFLETIRSQIIKVQAASEETINKIKKLRERGN
jgi:hypothetical protein